MAVVDAMGAYFSQDILLHRIFKGGHGVALGQIIEKYNWNCSRKIGLKFQNLAKIGQNHGNSKMCGPILFVMKCKNVGHEMLSRIKVFSISVR